MSIVQPGLLFYNKKILFLIISYYDFWCSYVTLQYLNCEHCFYSILKNTLKTTILCKWFERGHPYKTIPNFLDVGRMYTGDGM